MHHLLKPQDLLMNMKPQIRSAKCSSFGVHKWIVARRSFWSRAVAAHLHHNRWYTWTMSLNISFFLCVCWLRQHHKTLLLHHIQWGGWLLSEKPLERVPNIPSWGCPNCIITTQITLLVKDVTNLWYSSNPFKKTFFFEPQNPTPKISKRNILQLGRVGKALVLCPLK